MVLFELYHILAF